jgi:hypothetical protein
VKRTLTLLLTVALLLITTHRLPAPISEIPESPTPTPERSAKPKLKRTPKPKPAAQNSGDSVRQKATKISEQGDKAATKSDAASRGSPPGSTPAQVSAPPYAIPVPGHPNLVSSPYVRDKYIDIEGFTPGTEIIDPYAPGKTFLVPPIPK